MLKKSKIYNWIPNALKLKQLNGLQFILNFFNFTFFALDRLRIRNVNSSKLLLMNLLLLPFWVILLWWKLRTVFERYYDKFLKSLLSVFSILHKRKFHRFKIHLRRGLNNDDFDRKMECCENFTEVINNYNPHYLYNTCFSVESHFF